MKSNIFSWKVVTAFVVAANIFAMSNCCAMININEIMDKLKAALGDIAKATQAIKDIKVNPNFTDITNAIKSLPSISPQLLDSFKQMPKDSLMQFSEIAKSFQGISSDTLQKFASITKTIPAANLKPFIDTISSLKAQFPNDMANIGKSLPMLSILNQINLPLDQIKSLFSKAAAEGTSFASVVFKELDANVLSKVKGLIPADKLNIMDQIEQKKQELVGLQTRSADLKKSLDSVNQRFAELSAKVNDLLKGAASFELVKLEANAVVGGVNSASADITYRLGGKEHTATIQGFDVQNLEANIPKIIDSLKGSLGI
jgi:hypothetical protein